MNYNNSKRIFSVLMISFFLLAMLAMPAMAAGEFTVIRTISDTEVCAGDTVRVTLALTANQYMEAPAIQEELPSGWELTEVSDSGTYKEETTEWIWSSKMNQGNQKTVIYDLTVPEGTEAGVYNLSGSATAFEIDEISTTGDSQITVVDVVADFTSNVTSGDAPLAVKFTDISIAATSWQWDFDEDGVIDSTEQNPEYTYAEAGVYTVKLTASDGDSSVTETKTDYITVSLDAGFSANATSGNAPLTVKFTDTTSGAVSWEWDFDGDGTVDSTEQNPVHTYTSLGDYTVKLTAYGNGNSDSVTKGDYISVTSGSGSTLDADFTVNDTSGQAPLSVKFTDLSTGSITSWQWDFDYDGIIDSTEQNPVYTYTENGTYTVKLVVSDGSDSDALTRTGYIVVSDEEDDDDTYNAYEATAVSLSATIIPAISIEVTPGALNFGTLSAGEISDEHTLHIKNKGATDAKVTAQVTDVAKGLYEDGLMLNSGTWDGYSNVVESETTEDVQASLHVPNDFIGIGSMEGKLVFWAEVS
ncbi:PKD domain-containing protein [Methanolobus psychrotolerans]|uniref:PKD domain-containing protein n=1 Tax=Methanolobus psychrotolerans TaxID=1874706 RepID=UPI000B917BB5|nr:PKD domain-containing protein [Methanolobus psychrotolerans]